MGYGINASVDFGDLSMRINKKGEAPSENYRLRAVTSADYFLLVCEQGERKNQFCRKFGVTFLGIGTYTHNRCESLEHLVFVAKPAGFLGAARGKIFRVEIEHQPLSLELGERSDRSILVGSGKWRRRVAFTKRHSNRVIITGWLSTSTAEFYVK